jgi:hypothetical protein
MTTIPQQSNFVMNVFTEEYYTPLPYFEKNRVHLTPIKKRRNESSVEGLISINLFEDYSFTTPLRQRKENSPPPLQRKERKISFPRNIVPVCLVHRFNSESLVMTDIENDIVILFPEIVI